MRTAIAAAWATLCFASCGTTFGAPVQWPTSVGGNGHWYEAFGESPTTDGSFMRWDDAKVAAENMEFMGSTGHLATITSQEENEYLTETFPASMFNGALLYIGGFQPEDADEPDGDWMWVSGEEFTYTNWGANEPNSDGEDRMEIRTNGTWNDVTGSFVGAYIVEFSPIPEPNTIALIFGSLVLWGSCSRW